MRIEAVAYCCALGINYRFVCLFSLPTLVCFKNILCFCQSFAMISPFSLYKTKTGDTRWRSWLRHCATSRKVPGSFSDGGKGGRCVGLTTLPPSCDDCLEIWEPRPPGTLRISCNGIALKKNKLWFQASASSMMRSALFCVVTQRRVVILYRCLRTTYRSHLEGSRSLTLQDGTDRLSWNVGKGLPLDAA
jgi:hypothetical protein